MTPASMTQGEITAVLRAQVRELKIHLRFADRWDGRTMEVPRLRQMLGRMTELAKEMDRLVSERGAE